MHLSIFDWLVVAAYFAANLGIGLWYRSRATSSTEEYFTGGRGVSWWLAGTSMVATTFAADTPLVVTGIVATNGIAGNWVWWSFLMSAMLTVFFFAGLWRRAGVLTDVELAEVRYHGGAATFLRGFRALYLGLPINCIILGWVNMAMVKILQVLFGEFTLPVIGVTDPKIAALVIVFGIMLLTAGISSLSGLWGVLVTDLFQFFLKMGMVIVLAVYAVRAVGGMDALKLKLAAVDATRGGKGSILAFFPEVHSAWMPPLAFFVYLAVNWWATWYPGAEPGGGGYVAQRILSAKDERNGVLATLWFSIAHYAIRPWPWILTALASVVLYPDLKDKESGFVRTIVDPHVFPPALAGLMVAAFAAAYMSTIATQLNWGASYLVSDFYRRIIAKGRPDAHYVRVAQVATLLLMGVSTVVTYFMASIKDAWEFLMITGTGTGAVLILRWFWWRINAWSEVSAMASAFVVSAVLKYVVKMDTNTPDGFALTALITLAATTVVWVAVTLGTKPEPDATLVAFYRKVRPFAVGWGPIAAKAPDVVPESGMGRRVVDWVVGCAMIYFVLFGTGKVIFGESGVGLGLITAGVVAGVYLYRSLSSRGWAVVSGGEQR
jgi:solute:Na+ symporter, SSS family